MSVVSSSETVGIVLLFALRATLLTLRLWRLLVSHRVELFRFVEESFSNAPHDLSGHCGREVAVVSGHSWPVFVVVAHVDRFPLRPEGTLGLELG